jgi:hypothetical protein
MKVIKQSRLKTSDTMLVLVMTARDYGDLCRAVNIAHEFYKNHKERLAAGEALVMRDLSKKLNAIEEV